MKVVRILFLILYILIFISRAVLAEQLKEYSPYPVIFVHGYNAEEPPSWDSWKTAKKNIEKYFYENDKFKYTYLDEKEKYFPTINYGFQKTGRISRNGNIPDIARAVLFPRVKWALENCFPSDYPESERKVIIVAHSMGGLVTRSFLTQRSTYKNKIERVVFIDVPHLGSPYASALWMIDKEAKEKLPPLIKEHSTFFSKSAGALRFLLGPVGKSASEIIYSHVSWNLQKRLERDRRCLWIIENIFGTDPDGYAVDKMRLPFRSEYHDIITGRYGLKYKEVPIDIVYGPSETFLGSNILDKPSEFKTVIGEVLPDPSLTYKALNRGKGLLFWYREGSPLGFYFRPGYKLEGTETTGDGVVPKLSQEGIGEADYTVNAWHGAAPESWETILKAIDDPPKIERVWAVPCYWDRPESNYYYVIIKVKEYLLADLEIESMDLDGVDVDLREFYDTQSKTYKPYYKFGKNFLKRRPSDIKDVNGNTITLEPGEFYVKVGFPAQGGYGSYTTYDLTYAFNITLKNPAGKENEEKRILIYRPKAEASFSAYTIDVPEHDHEDMPKETTMKDLHLESGNSEQMYIEVGMADYYTYDPFIKLQLPNDGNVNLNYNEDFYELDLSDYTMWDGANGSGGTVEEEAYYKVKIILIPQNRYARPISGDLKMDIPTFVWQGVIRADPTFIQSHRSYNQLARFNKLRNFKKYGYSLKKYRLNTNEEPCLLSEVKDGLNDNLLIAYEYQLIDSLSKKSYVQLDGINKVIRQKIEDAIIKVLEIEDNFHVEKQRIISKIEAELSDMNKLQALKENNVSKELIKQMEGKNNQLKSQKIAQSIKKLKENKKARIASIIKNTNNSISALIKKASSDTVASRLLSE